MTEHEIANNTRRVFAALNRGLANEHPRVAIQACVELVIGFAAKGPHQQVAVKTTWDNAWQAMLDFVEKQKNGTDVIDKLTITDE